MKWINRTSEKIRSLQEGLHLRLSRPDALLQLAILGVMTGILAGLTISAFRWIIEYAQSSLLPGNGMENYEELPGLIRVLLPVSGGLAIGLLFHFFARGSHIVGIVHVMERMAYHQGYLTLRGTIMQFVGGAIAIITGHSVGREGPAVHLGASSGSLLAQQLKLPNNTIRTLVGCGTAAAISASFNTPLAGVVFALEVIMLDYSLASFTPIILAAVSADAVSILIFGNTPVIIAPATPLESLWELMIVVFLGLIIGLTSSAFITTLQKIATHTKSISFWIRTSLAGLITGLCALAFPQIMGMGYDTLNSALAGELALGILLGITLFKLFASAAVVGLGIPGGLIGPTLVIGATMGGFIGMLAAMWFPDTASSSGFYALLGLGAMMGATLQAPLAALTAMMELTSNPHIILPGMLAIITAGLTNSELFGKASIFITLLRARGLDYRNDPITQALHRVGVGSAMDRGFAQLETTVGTAEAKEALSQNPEWILIKQEGEVLAIMPAVDLARQTQESSNDEESIDLMSIPAIRLQPAAIDLNATLQEAMDQLKREQAEALYVRRMTAPSIYRIYGVLTQEKIEASYRN